MPIYAEQDMPYYEFGTPGTYRKMAAGVVAVTPANAGQTSVIATIPELGFTAVAALATGTTVNTYGRNFIISCAGQTNVLNFVFDVAPGEITMNYAYIVFGEIIV